MINEQIPERRSSISTFRDMYLEIIECLNEVNISIYGLPALVAFIAANLAEIILAIYSNVLFPRDYEYDPYLALTFIRLSMEIINVLTLYLVGHSTEKEVFILYYLNLL